MRKKIEVTRLLIQANKILEEEEKKMKARRKEIIALKETFKSPSVLLKEHDAEYVNNLINNQVDTLLISNHNCSA